MNESGPKSGEITDRLEKPQAKKELPFTHEDLMLLPRVKRLVTESNRWTENGFSSEDAPIKVAGNEDFLRALIEAIVLKQPVFIKHIGLVFEVDGQSGESKYVSGTSEFPNPKEGDDLKVQKLVEQTLKERVQQLSAEIQHYKATGKDLSEQPLPVVDSASMSSELTADPAEIEELSQLTEYSNQTDAVAELETPSVMRSFRRFLSRFFQGRHK